MEVGRAGKGGREQERRKGKGWEGERRMKPGGEGVWGSPEGEGQASSSIETLTEGRRGRPELSLTLGNTGLTRNGPLVQRDRAAIVKVLKTAFRPTIRNST